MASLNTAPIAFPWAGRMAILPAQSVGDGGNEADMSPVTSTLRCLVCFALLELVRPVLVTGQESEFLASTALTPSIAWAATEEPLNITPPTITNPFGLTLQTHSQYGDGNQSSADTLAFQFDRGSSSAWLTETYFATPPTLADLSPKEWSNGLAAGGTWFLTKSNTTAFHFMRNLDSSTTNVGGLPFDQYDGSYLTVRWGASHLFLSNTGRNDLQIDLAGYAERMVSPPHSAVAFYMADPIGYAASSSGAEATFSLPSRNIVFSVRYGSERVAQQPARSHLLQFQLSWSW